MSRNIDNVANLKTIDGLTVCAPENPLITTTYSLLESGDWIDPEIKLVRDFVEPGMNCIDVGAGYGVYALLMSSLSHAQGSVYAFEPEDNQLSHLKKSKSKNQLNNIRISNQGLSDKPELLFFYKNESPELSTISPLKHSDEKKIETTCLDKWWDDNSKIDINLLKIDANGHEPMILQGAKRFLSQTSPLAVIAVSSPDPLINNLYTKTKSLSVKILKSLGYEIFLYTDNQHLLIPINQIQEIDAKTLNIVACKVGMIAKLREKGLIPDISTVARPAAPDDFWKTKLGELKFAKLLLPHWENINGNEEYLYALNLLCLAHDKEKMPSGNRIAMLFEAQKVFTSISENNPGAGSAHLCASRVCLELGNRLRAADILKKLIYTINHKEAISFELPFLCPLPEMDHYAVRQSPQKWIVSCCQEALVFLKHFSSYFIDKETLEYISDLKFNPGSSHKIQKSINLLNLKHGHKPFPFVTSSINDCNQWFWNRIYQSKHLQKELRVEFSEPDEKKDKINHDPKKAIHPGIWEANNYPNETQYLLSGIITDKIDKVYIYCDDVYLKKILVHEQDGKYRKFNFFLKKDTLDRIKKNSILRITSDQGTLYNSNGTDFQIIHGFSSSNDLQILFDKGWYLTKKGDLILPLAVDEDKRSKVFALYTGLNKYFKKNFGYNLWVAHGSLLGLYRDNALIPFDDDFDLAYLSRMTTPREIMFERVHIASKMKLDGWNMSISATGLFKLMPKDAVDDPEKDKYLDIMPAWWQSNHLFCLAWTMLKICPEDMMPLQEVEHYGTKFLFPRRPEVFLRHKYGPGWNTPDKGYTPKRPAGSDHILNQGMARPAEVAMFSL